MPIVQLVYFYEDVLTIHQLKDKTHVNMILRLLLHPTFNTEMWATAATQQAQINSIVSFLLLQPIMNMQHYIFRQWYNQQQTWSKCQRCVCIHAFIVSIFVCRYL